MDNSHSLSKRSRRSQYLKVASLFDALVADCPLAYTSPNAPEKRDVECAPWGGQIWIKGLTGLPGFHKELSDTHFPDAVKIVLVQDNLNTHKPASLYEAFPAQDVKQRAKVSRF